MATIKFLTQSKAPQVPIYVRLSLGRGKDFKRKTGYLISSKNWSKAKGVPIQRDEILKNLSADLDSFKSKLSELLNVSVKKGVEINGSWLQEQVDIINNKVPIQEMDVLTTYIQRIVDTAHRKMNARGGLGLSERRIKGYITFLGVIRRYQEEVNRGRDFLIRDVNLKFAESFKDWLFSKNYSINYVGKNLDNLKAVCNDADSKGIETSRQFKKIRGITEKKSPESIVFLSEREQEKIAGLELKKGALENARKWLLLGCLLGQRGSDLLELKESQIIDMNGVKIAEIRQSKTGKLVAVPLLPKAREIISEGFPYKIALQNFNEYIKEICLLAEINELTLGRKRVKDKNSIGKNQTYRNLPSVKGRYPKYELIGSHVCRRSFASNFYGKIPTPVLINITGHGTEKMFLKYIGKTTYDNAFQMVDYVNKLQQKEKGEPIMKVVKNASN